MASAINKLFVNPVKYREFRGDLRGLERKTMYELYAKSSKEIWIVAGELNPKFYNKLFADIIRIKLKTIPDFKFSILFSKDASLTSEEKIKKIFEENKELCELLKNEAFVEGRFFMFLSNKCPENHFGIADNSILIERVHKQGEPRDVLLVENYQVLVENYKKYFKKLTLDPGIKPLTPDSFKGFAA